MERSGIVYHICKSCIAIRKNLTFAHFLVNFLALKLIQHAIAIEYWINKKPRHRLIFAQFLVNFLALKLIQHEIAIGSIRNLDTGSF
jgi:hypothetical protein